jgi:predicted metal-dependent peptidase
MDALDRGLLGAARFRAAFEYPYLTHALFALTPVACADLPSPTMAVDQRWRLYVDPGFLARTPVEQVAGVLVHEVMHLVFDHGGRADTLGVTNHHRWNLACDAAINRIITTRESATGHPLELPNPVLPEHLGFESNPDVPAEIIYLSTINLDRVDDRDNADPDNEEAADCGSGSHGASRRWERSEVTGQVAGLSDVEVDLVRRRTATAITECGTSTVSPSLLRWANTVLESRVDWRRELAGAVRHGLATVAGMQQPTYSRPSRRTAASRGVLLPGQRRPVAQIAVVVDSSASMDAAAIDDAIAEVHGILRSGGVRGRDIRVWGCDTDANEINLSRGLAGSALRGGGGTDMAEGIRAACADRRFRPHFIVVLTDGDTAWPDAPPGPRVIVGLIESHHARPRPTPEWARVVRVPRAESSAA